MTSARQVSVWNVCRVVIVTLLFADVTRLSSPMRWQHWLLDPIGSGRPTQRYECIRHPATSRTRSDRRQKTEGQKMFWLDCWLPWQPGGASLSCHASALRAQSISR